jgi:ABC-type branched-subunit amino acid transport system substrate-binding protein
MATLCAVVLLVMVGVVVPPSPRQAGDEPTLGATIMVATLGDFDVNGVDNRQWADAVRARFNAANARGGLADAFGRRHLVVVIECNTASDPEQTAGCARQAVDQHVTAVVGMSAVYGDRALPILDAAGIPALGVRVNTGADGTSSASFPLASGFAAELMAMPQLLARERATKIAVIISDFGPATDDVLGLLERGMSLTKAATGPTVRVAPDAMNLSAAVSAAAQPGVDGIIGFVAGGRAGALVQQLRASNFTGEYATRAPWGNAEAASDPDLSVDGTLVVGQFTPPTCDVRGWNDFRRDMRASGMDLVSPNEGTVNYWLAARVFQHVVRAVEVGRINASVIDPLVYDGNNDTGGLTPSLARTASPSDQPRLVNHTVTFNTTSDGDLRLLTPRFFDPFAGRHRASAVSLRSCTA